MGYYSTYCWMYRFSLFIMTNAIMNVTDIYGLSLRKLSYVITYRAYQLTWDFESV